MKFTRTLILESIKEYVDSMKLLRQNTCRLVFGSACSLSPSPTKTLYLLTTQWPPPKAPLTSTGRLLLLFFDVYEDDIFLSRPTHNQRLTGKRTVICNRYRLEVEEYVYKHFIRN